jgi:hypothetical protein
MTNDLLPRGDDAHDLSIGGQLAFHLRFATHALHA